MRPRFVAISGPIKGSEFPLEQGVFTIGRESSNTLWLEHSSVSRRHSVVSVQDERFSITDLESRNGTFVNRIPVKERELSAGDEVQIGEYVFLFLTKEPIAAAPGPPEDSKLLTRSAVLRPEDSTYMTPGRVESELGRYPSGQTARIARDLNTLLAASEAIHSLRGTEAIVRQILQSAFEVTGTQHGDVTLFDGDESGASGYQDLIDQVKAERATVLYADADGGALLGTPIFAFEKLLGAIALEAEKTFDESHLQLVAALGAIAGPALENALRLELVESENRRLQEEIRFQHNMVGESGPMQAVFQMIAKAAPSEATVLIRGESGTGKELVARAIHAGSRRSSKAFVAINCATLSETLIESELFGHERGAFTGALAQKRGKIELADGGTLFLDEVGELAPALQAKLLRVLQEREFERVGGTRPMRVDIRVVAATNRDLEESGTFRRDLYYRLNVISLMAPPLRERREDIPLLAKYFVAKYAEKTGRKVAGISPAARAYLARYDWPGNVRELENAMERAVVLGSSELLEPEDLPESVVESAAGVDIPVGGYHAALIEAKKRLILGAIEQAGGSQLGASKLLGINATYLSRLIRNLNLKAALKQA
jgi:transcriptional regulator with GAF, ATPase, and Fis domain